LNVDLARKDDPEDDATDRIGNAFTSVITITNFDEPSGGTDNTVGAKIRFEWNNDAYVFTTGCVNTIYGNAVGGL
jgi:hypothetical protein